MEQDDHMGGIDVMIESQEAQVDGEASQGKEQDNMGQELENEEKKKKVYKTAKIKRMLKRQEEDVKTKKLEEAAKDMISGKIPGLR